MNTESFIGQGWSFPPSFNRNEKKVEMSNGVNDIHQSLEIIFTTSLGERIMHPEFGCSLKEMMYEPMNTGVIAYIKNLIETAILYHEPRIVTEQVNIESDINGGALWIQIEYTVRGTNTRFNYVYPFYLNEATG